MTEHATAINLGDDDANRTLLLDLGDVDVIGACYSNFFVYAPGINAWGTAAGIVLDAPPGWLVSDADDDPDEWHAADNDSLVDAGVNGFVTPQATSDLRWGQKHVLVGPGGEVFHFETVARATHNPTGPSTCEFSVVAISG